MRILSVQTKDHHYPIFVTDQSISTLAEVLLPYLTHQAAIVTNTTVAPLYLAQLHALLQQLNIPYFEIILPDGEQYKNSDTLNLIYDGLLSHQAERKTTLLALGGGVIGDISGFAAATYQRGIPFIQIPTTLLSQVDSSVGGKTAINHPMGKNMIGAFYQPQAVLTSIPTLTTLPDRELSAGLAEIIKIALIWDQPFFVWLEEHMQELLQKNPESLAIAIERSCAIKAKIVSQDEKEHGVRALLNLGHTFGHAIETEMGYGVWLHGEAVAAGTVLAARLSQNIGFITEADFQRITNLFTLAKLPVKTPAFATDNWLSHMSHDKKVSAGKLRFVLLEAMGKGTVADNITQEQLLQVLSDKTLIQD